MPVRQQQDDPFARWISEETARWQSVEAALRTQPALIAAAAGPFRTWAHLLGLLRGHGHRSCLFYGLRTADIADNPALGKAYARYCGVLAAAWGQLQLRLAQEVMRADDPDPERLRKHSLMLMEHEVLITLRSEAFLSAQRDLVRAALDAGIPIMPRTFDRMAPFPCAHDTVDPPTENPPENPAENDVACLIATLTALDPSNNHIGTAARTEIWREDKIHLARYNPARPGPKLGPVLIVHGLIGRQSLADLTPERSLIRKLIAAGVDLFVLDWGNAGPEDSARGFERYADFWLGRALDHVLAASGARQAALLGICQGGVLAMCHAALYPERISGLILGVTPTDFHADLKDRAPGLLNHWIRSFQAGDLRDLVDQCGNVPGDLMAGLFHQLNPVHTLRRYTIDLMERCHDPEGLATFIAMEHWLEDRPDMPGRLAREWLISLYLENRLAKGMFKINGHLVDLEKITCPVLNIMGRKDHIIPLASSQALGRYIAPDRYRELILETGHAGVFVSTGAQKVLAPAIAQWLDKALA